jgi:hypothetical protein
MRFRLRYLHHDLELSEGQFAVGRSADCQLSLDDPLVSRRHALLVVGQGGVTVEDLQSRNGVVVNGQRIAEKTPLQPGDKIVIGSQELTLLRARDVSLNETVNFAPPRGTLPRIPAVMDLDTDRPAVPPRADVGDSSVIRKVAAFKLLGGVADKALAMGRAEEAERLLSGPLLEVVEASREGRQVSQTLVDDAARFGAKLATASGKGSWADYAIELYRLQGRPCTAAVVDELNTAFRKVNAIDLVRLREYLAVLHGKQATFGPAERFLLQRIEGLERLAALR